jgi:hypothetical protein
MNDRKEQILEYLYTFRFLSRNQIQLLLGHKQFNRIIVWLNELTKSGYIRRYYNPKTVTLPALYSLGLKSRECLGDNSNFKSTKTIQFYKRIWRENRLSAQFRQHCLFIADIYLSLQTLVDTTGAKLDFYTKTSLNGLEYMIEPNPDGYFSIEEKNGLTKEYFLDVFDDLPARMVLRRRIRQYFEYYEDTSWQTQKPFPYIILICPDDQSKNYLNKFIPKMLEDEPDLSFYLSTWEKIKAQGLNQTSFQKVELKK